jgi:hypothetical protein
VLQNPRGFTKRLFPKRRIDADGVGAIRFVVSPDPFGSSSAIFFPKDVARQAAKKASQSNQAGTSVEFLHSFYLCVFAAWRENSGSGIENKSGGQ